MVCLEKRTPGHGRTPFFRAHHFSRHGIYPMGNFPRTPFFQARHLSHGEFTHRNTGFVFASLRSSNAGLGVGGAHHFSTHRQGLDVGGAHHFSAHTIFPGIGIIPQGIFQAHLYSQIRFSELGTVLATLYCSVQNVQYGNVQYCSALYSTVQYTATVLYSTVQHCTVQHCTVQYRTVQHCTVYYRTVL